MYWTTLITTLFSPTSDLVGTDTTVNLSLTLNVFIEMCSKLALKKTLHIICHVGPDENII